MGDLLKALQKWLRRNKSEQTPRKPDDKRDRKERNWYSRKGWDGAQKEKEKEKEKEKVKPNCIFCEKDHCMGRRMRCFRHAYKTQGIFHEKCVSTAVAQVIERERMQKSRLFQMQGQTPHKPVWSTQHSVHWIHPDDWREIIASHHTTEDRRCHLVGLPRYRVWEKLYIKRCSREFKA